MPSFYLLCANGSNGDGGDEMLAGYGTYGNWLRKVDYYRSANETGWRGKIRPLAKAAMPWRYSQAYDTSSDPQHWTDCVNRYTDAARERLWRPELRFLTDQRDEAFDHAFEIGGGLRGVNRVQRCDMETFLPEDILCKVDIASMRFGLEVRPPMLDRNFFGSVSSIAPGALYARDSDGHSYSGKIPLKTLAAKKLGGAFANRPKQGFVMPLQSWFDRNTGQADDVRQRLTDPGASIAQWFEQEQVHVNLDAGRVVNVWLLLVLEEWLCQIGSRETSAA
ncbi:Putative asparagine synthetase [glutamine-hydrolyzing] [Rosistilla ulvae]|uniref:Asparagine synthetase [glutamine-hydrolyzing] n=1 Tax=Rosistilla ulvae TaxID=1930277 RepID=A0A517M212_9BACT|nr:asparagine synthase-related protein [Rosistilla ulvae]QDS88913.1 Putative asparagine synthetase [glutamine-hydrolyzing] [Rosistilla ulvae]